MIWIVLGVLGLALTRWEVAGGRLHYTPNRWLVLSITLVVTCRLAYGMWRSWEAWHASVDRMAWVAASGVMSNRIFIRSTPEMPSTMQ